MVPTPINHAHVSNRYPRLAYSLLALATHGVKKLVGYSRPNVVQHLHLFTKREEEPHDGQFIVFACLIPVLVLLSGLFAGLTLGYMSLDETQLHVLSISGTPKQRKYAKKILPIRKNGHLLLITLLLANMVVNEALPVISEPVLGGGFESVAVSTVLIVIFSEIIPQSLCTRYGLAIGANMAWLIRIMFYTVGIVSWPVAKFMELILGRHHGIMYRRAELKELIAMHATAGVLGGDLQSDTVNIIGATLDLQEKVVRQAMTPLDKTFMLSIDSKLDFETMKRIGDTGHSRVPIYEEVEVPVIEKIPVPVKAGALTPSGAATPPKPIPTADDVPLPSRVMKVKKIVGVLLVKQLLLLDPKDATPLRTIPLNSIPCVPSNEPILNILDKFQEGRSHMAIVSRFSVEKAKSVQKEVKKGLTQRLKDRVGMGDSSSSDSSSDESGDEATSMSDRDATLRGDKSESGKKKRKWGRKGSKKRKADGTESKTEDIEKGDVQVEKKSPGGVQSSLAKALALGREQRFPDDAALGQEQADDFVQSMDPYVMPLGIITLEDVVEELIGEEIYDEFDREGQGHLGTHVPDVKRLFTRRRAADPSPARPVETSGSELHPRGAQTAPNTPLMKPLTLANPPPSTESTPTVPSGQKKLNLMSKVLRARRANTMDNALTAEEKEPAAKEKETKQEGTTVAAKAADAPDATHHAGEQKSEDAAAANTTTTAKVEGDDEKEGTSETRPADKKDAPDKGADAANANANAD